ncbi:S53 family peptidase [Streptomyces xylophagus]|uniref:S53 family peptidase n=1 Tax=Streptomyces xylophagus TaxID=285514 RepID=UPI0005B7AE99|nr:S53 family peptidase [Streptomyces xylophagus]
MTRPLYRRVLAAALLLGAAVAVPASAATPSETTATSTTPTTTAVDVCGTARPGYARCLSRLRPGAAHKKAATATPDGAASLPAGYGPADLQSAYGLGPAIAAGGGTGMTVAVVDAYDDPTAEADLAVYRSTYGLPPCTTANGCFTKTNQSGAASPLPVANGSWAVETSLDLQAASAACPACHITLVEGDSASLPALAAAENTAVALGANAVSNSYSAAENSTTSTYASAYDHPGVAITASSGDSGYQLAAPFPADLPTVTAVGGTTLTPATSTARGWSETAWALNAKGSAAGSACSAWFDKPSWQHDTACPGRTVADVSADADPATGYAVYDTTPNPYGITPGWFIVGGTSASSPFIAGVYALAGNTGQIDDASRLYARRRHLHDISGGSVSTKGENQDCPTTSYLCTALSGYDAPTGLGSPNGTAGF